uniref:hypothetical protein n=1 Tax=Pseudomonas aeruginosa TaxID=287 RepID=UPI001160F442|nr:hypothetical protein [Pseudomonas aeruginosa]
MPTTYQCLAHIVRGVSQQSQSNVSGCPKCDGKVETVEWICAEQLEAPAQICAPASESMNTAQRIVEDHKKHGGYLIPAIEEARELAVAMESDSCINRV